MIEQVYWLNSCYWPIPTRFLLGILLHWISSKLALGNRNLDYFIELKFN
jgi:hypothetical protein